MSNTSTRSSARSRPGGETPSQRPDTGRDGTAAEGYLHCGPSGGGHFVKMVHNGIEYGMMAAYAEGLNILKHANAGKQERAANAETTPLRHPEHYQYEFDLPAVAEVWRRGSVIASWLLDLTAAALAENPPGEFLGSCLRFRRGTLDAHRGDRGVRARACPERSVISAIRSRGEAKFRTNCSRRCGPIRRARGAGAYFEFGLREPVAFPIARTLRD